MTGNRKIMIFYAGYLAVAAALQLVCGNFPLKVFAFPLNVILSIIWIVILWISLREWRERALVRLLASNTCSVGSLVLFLCGCLVIGLFPQLSEAEIADKQSLITRLGLHQFTTSWPFVAILFLLMSNLTMVIFRVIRAAKRPQRVRFLLNHVGLWLALFGGFFGSVDTQTLHQIAYRQRPTREAFDADGRTHTLPFVTTFHDFAVNYSGGMPSRFWAKITINKDTVELEVNSPHRLNFSDDVYLTSYDMMYGNQTPYCVLQIVRQPWRYVMLGGIVLMALGALLLFVRGPQRKEDVCC